MKIVVFNKTCAEKNFISAVIGIYPGINKNAFTPAY
jgi:hypothetical protein